MLLRSVIACVVMAALITAVSQALAPASACEEDASCVRCPACCQFNRLNTEMRDARTNRANAQARFRALISLIRENYYARGGVDWTKDEWVFPLDGYGPKAIGGRNGSGYRSKGHDYFDGNNHRSHPAHDIFINDKNRDCLDDRTGKPVMVRSMTNGIIIAEETEWDPTSYLRGGRYIWIYDPSIDGLVYYAHNATVLVAVGDIVNPEDAIATVGRTGLNAFRRRSQTHLHLSYLEVRDGNVVARNIYDNLLRSRAERWSGRPRPAFPSAAFSPHQGSPAQTKAISPVTVSGLETPPAGYANISW